MFCTLFATILLFFGSHRCDALVGANSTISNLTAKTTLAGGDLIPIVDNSVSPATTKQITVTNASSSFKTYNDTVYSPIAGGTGIVTLGTIATGVWGGTTIGASKGGTGSTTLAVNHILIGNGTGIVGSVALGTAGQILTSNGSGVAPSMQSVAVALNTDNTWTGAQTFNTATTTFNATTTGNGVHFKNGNYATTTAGGTINGYTLPVPVSLSTSTLRVVAMDGNDITALDNYLGFAVTNGTNGSEIVVQTDGIVNGFSGLTIGRRYYVQDAVGTIGMATGTYDFYVGIAASTTALLMDRGDSGMQYLGTCSSSSCTIPPLARMMVVQAVGSYTCAAGGGTVQVQQTLFMVGARSATDKGNTYCDGNSASDQAFTISSSISGAVLTVSQTSLTSVTADVYFYR